MAKAAEYLGQGDGQDTAGLWATVAQVHATLAVAATFERTQTGSTRPEAARASYGAGDREHRIFSFSAGRRNSDTPGIREQEATR